MPDNVFQYPPYGLTLPAPPRSNLELELICYRWHRELRASGHINTNRVFHYRNIARMIWGEANKNCQFEWNPWAERLADAVHVNPYTGEDCPHTGISGCASSGKSHGAALYALVNWLCDPLGTMVLVTSTDIPGARKRIWGSIEKLFIGAGGILPGRLISSECRIDTVDPGSKQRQSGQSGIFLIASEKRKEKEAIGKIIGSKNRRVLFIADELPELPESIAEACFSNLISNPFFQFIALGNFKSRYDSFGQFVEPATGYDTLTVDDEFWQIKRGHCIRFDGMRSPNITGGKDVWEGIYKGKHLAQHRRDLGENTAGFWRMCRSFEAPMGFDDVLYSDADFHAAGAHLQPVWTTIPVVVSAIDPSFTQGGDRCCQVFGKLGQTDSGLTVLAFTGAKLLREDVRVKQPRNFQIARQFIDNCVQAGVKPEHAAIEASAGGDVLADIICEEWGTRELLRVISSGAPSDLVVSAGTRLTGKDKYDRRISELWGIGREFLRCKQFCGLTPELMREMKARKYDQVKGMEGLKIRVEKKDEMKTRLGFSPDEADAFFTLLELCRKRLFFTPGDEKRGKNTVKRNFVDIIRKTDEVYHDLYAEP